jgi:methylmalonyl-CoA/ethylmalonyl-CoA epimerase
VGERPAGDRGQGPWARGSVGIPPGVLLGIHHVGVVVRDLEAAVEEYRRLLGIEPAHRERVDDQGVEEVLYRVGGSWVQLLGALGPDTPVGRFLDRRGEGLHHLAYRVDDVAGALAALRAAGVPLVDEAPRRGSRGTRIAFVHPRGMRGVLVELVEDRAEPAPQPDDPGPPPREVVPHVPGAAGARPPEHPADRRHGGPSEAGPGAGGGARRTSGPGAAGGPRPG